MNFSLRKPQRSAVPVSQEEIKKLGITKEGESFVENLQDLRKNPPNLVSGECIENTHYLNHSTQTLEPLHKKKSYIMSSALYQMLHVDSRLNKKILRPDKEKFSSIYKPYIGQNLDNKKLLVYRTGGIGDLLFIQPNLIYLKEKYPTCHIKLACAPQYHSMVKTWNCVNEVIQIPTLKQYFYICDYHAIFEGVIERCKQAESINAYNLFSTWLGLNLPNEKLIPDQEPDFDKYDKFSSILKNNGFEKFILFQLRASSPIRTPRPEHFRKIINNLTSENINVVITDMKKREEDVEYFISTLDNKDKVFNFAKYSDEIADTICAASLSQMVVAVDSALPHIAASVGVPIYGIFGSFLGELRLSTYPNCKWYNCSYQCAPCFKHGMNVCIYNKDGYPKCFDNIDINFITNEIKEMYYK